MEHPPKRASFEGIPSEIRLTIYSYLLSDKNVVVLGPKRVLRPQYQTALFTVNKKISSESLTYFCAENGFVAIGSNMGYFLRTCTHAVPLIVGDSVRHFNHYILSAELVTYNAAGAAELGGVHLALLACRHLSNFVRLLNAEHSTIRNVGRTSTVHLLYCTKSNFFTPKPSVIDCVVDGIKGIRKIENHDGGHLRITIDGDLEMEKAESIKAATDPPALTLAEVLDQAVQAKERGNNFYRACDYNAARCEYFVAIYTMGNMHNELRQDPILRCRLESLLVNLYTNTSLLDSKQGAYESAVLQAEMAWDATNTRAAGDTSTPAQKAKLLYRLGCTLVDVGKDGKAIERLKEAHSYVPGDIHINAKLEEVTTRFESRRKKLDMKYRARMSEKAFGWNLGTWEQPAA
ncbi:peptidyl-prolyl cis-trans isomerase cpr6 [Xylographa trunciseda]|nr:peptidyl-prolyl cis-trans isomerase cpr6 [Xylographa trunciseda]